MHNLKIGSVIVSAVANEETTVQVFPESKEQHEFETSLRDLVGWLKVLKVGKLTIIFNLNQSTGNGLVVPDWFIYAFREMGVTVEFKREPYLFRLHLRPQGGTADQKTTWKFCSDNGILGVGWCVEGLQDTNRWDLFNDKAIQYYSNAELSVCRYINRWVGRGDLIWTRDYDGNYYLAQATSGWKYLTNNLGVDVCNVFSCEIKAVPIDHVPGKVVACFRPPRTFQEIADRNVLQYSKKLWNDLSGHPEYTHSIDCEDIFMMLDDRETEDLVLLFLQSDGWILVPSSRRRDTMKYECLLVNKDGLRALVQVKTGNDTLRPEDYAGSSVNTVFLFQSKGNYIGSDHENVTCLTPCELKTFMSSQTWLPGVYRIKQQLLE